MTRKNQDQSVVYKVGNDEVKLSPAIVRQYLVNGNGNVTDQEVIYFIHLCRGQGLNPFLKEAYLIKYGNGPATTVVSKEAFMKRAERNEAYDGNEAGIIVLDADGNIQYRRGTFYNKNSEELLGGWAEVYKKGISHPTYVDVNLDEYIGKTKDGLPNSMWVSKKSTMIRKVALVQALREAFPQVLNQMFTDDEIDVHFDDTPNQQPMNDIQPPELIQVDEQQISMQEDNYYRQNSQQVEAKMERPSFV